MSAEICIGICTNTTAGRDFVYAGTTGEQQWEGMLYVSPISPLSSSIVLTNDADCGNSINSTISFLQPESKCNAHCHYNIGETCGSNGFQSVYTREVAQPVPVAEGQPVGEPFEIAAQVRS